MTALLPCPFCGEPGGEQPGAYGYSAWVGCKNALCLVRPSSQFHTRAKAFAAWNRRATPASPDGYVLVPRDATDWMVSEARRYLFAGNSETNIEMAWRAMIDAAPPPLSAHLDAERLVEGRGEGEGSSRTDSGGSPPTAAKSESGEGH